MSLATIFTMIISASFYDFMIVFALIVIMRHVRPMPLTLVSDGELKKIS